MSSLVNFTGLASGIDTASIVDALVNQARGPINRLENKRSDLGSQKNIFNRIDGKLDSLGDVLDELRQSSTLASFTASSSDEAVVRVAAGNGASKGRFALEVVQLAESQRTYSETVAARDQAGLFGTGTLTIDVGGNAFDVTVDGTTTLEDVADAINDSGEAVSASILFDGTNYRLQVSGTETGAANAVGFTENGVSLGLSTPANTVQSAQDAQFEIDGLPFTSASNVVNDAISGLTLNLQSVGTSNVDVGPDNAGLKDVVTDFVSKLNAVINDVKAEFTVGNRDPSRLFGDSTLRSLQSQLSQTLTSPVTIGGSTRLLSEIGIETTRDGNVELDSTKLEAALSENADAVRELFAGDGTDDGFGAVIASVVDGFADSANGRLKARADGIDSEVRSINDQIDRLEDRLTAYEEQLTAEFIFMEQTIATLNSQNDFLLAQLASLPG